MRKFDTDTEGLHGHLFGGLDLRDQNGVWVYLLCHDMECKGVPLLRCEELQSQQLTSETVMAENCQQSAEYAGQCVRHRQEF